MCSAERNYNAVAVRTFFEVFSFHNNDVFCLHLKVDVELNLRPKDQRRTNRHQKHTCGDLSDKLTGGKNETIILLSVLLDVVHINTITSILVSVYSIKKCYDFLFKKI